MLIDGGTVTVKVAHVRLCHSRVFFVRASPRETREPQPSGSDRWRLDGFDVRRRAKTAVDAIFLGKNRAYNRRFLQMCGISRGSAVHWA